MAVDEQNAGFRMMGMAQLLDQGASQSGHERNHLFHNVDGDEFLDLSGISGLDHPGDGRSVALFDFDRDGRQDLAFVNSNRPLFQIRRNRADTRDSSFIALRFVGGMRPGESRGEWSNRDGVGVIIRARLGETTLLRESRAGEGLAAQNSATLHLGIGVRERVDELEIRWPSGKISRIEDVPAGSLATIYENREHSPSGESFVAAPYHPEKIAARPSSKATPPEHAATLDLEAEPKSKLRLVTTMADWCLPCLVELPYLRELKSRFSDSDLALFGIPIETEKDSLTRWLDENEPPYAVLHDLPPERVDAVQKAIEATLGSTAIPASVVIDAAGEVLLVRSGPPTVSEIRRLLAEQG